MLLWLHRVWNQNEAGCEGTFFFFTSFDFISEAVFEEALSKLSLIVQASWATFFMLPLVLLFFCWRLYLDFKAQRLGKGVRDSSSESIWSDVIFWLSPSEMVRDLKTIFLHIMKIISRLQARVCTRVQDHTNTICKKTPLPVARQWHTSLQSLSYFSLEENKVYFFLKKRRLNSVLFDNIWIRFLTLQRALYFEKKR